MHLTVTRLPGIAVDGVDEWQHSSPTGGFIPTADIPAGLVIPGMVVRATGGHWAAVAARASRLQKITGLFPITKPVFGWHMVRLDDRWHYLWPHNNVQIRTDLHVQEDAL